MTTIHAGDYLDVRTCTPVTITPEQTTDPAIVDLVSQGIFSLTAPTHARQEAPMNQTCTCGRPVEYQDDTAAWMTSCRACLLAEDGVRRENGPGAYPRPVRDTSVTEDGPAIILTEVISHRWASGPETPFKTNTYRFLPIPSIALAYNDPATPPAPEDTCPRCNGTREECNRDCTCNHCGRHDCSGECNPQAQDALRRFAEAIATPPAPEDDPWTVCPRCGSDVRSSERRTIGCDLCQPDDEPATPSAQQWPTTTLGKTLRLGAVVSSLALTLIGYHGHPLPDIGTHAYSDSCHVTHAWEDGSAIAQCAEDGATYAYDPDGNHPPTSVGYHGPEWDAGWYVVTDDNPYTVDHTRKVG